MIRAAILWAAGAAALLATFAGTAFAAHAAGLPTEDSTIPDLLKAIVDAFRGGDRVVAGALTLFAAVALAKKYLTTGAAGKWLHGPTGATLTVFLMSVAGTVAATGAGPWHWATLWTAGGVGIAAIGGYTAVKLLVVDPVRNSKWFATAPEWFKTAFSVLTWIVDKPSAVAEAQAAGDAAVRANPSPGADGIVGPATKF